MKNFLLFLCCIIFGQLQAAILPNENCTLYEHLLEVNQEWQYFYAQDDFFTQRIDFQEDTERIQLHLQLVEQILRQRSIKHLTKSQQKNRAHHLDVLQRYWQRNLFPKNTHHSHRQPYFVDKYNTACAVGYLLREDGQNELVNRIHIESNYAYIRALTHYKELSTWATTNGFTVEELAWIQPGYPPPIQEIRQLGNGGGANGIVNAIEATEELLYIGGDFTEIDGVAAAGLIAWDGEDWISADQNFSGIVTHIVEDAAQNGLYVAGEFYLNNSTEITRLARLHNGEWIPLITGDWDGIIHDLYHNGRLFVGGEFNNIAGMEASNLAYYESWVDTWSTNSLSNNADIPGGFSVNGPVYDFQWTGSYLLIGGDFDEVGTLSEDPSIIFTTQYLAYVHLNTSWVSATLEGNYPVPHHLYAYNNVLLLAHNTEDDIILKEYAFGIWDDFSAPLYFNEEGDGIYGFFTHNDALHIYGGFRVEPLIGTWGDNIMAGNENSATAIIDMNDGVVTHATAFQGDVYFSGTFTTIQGENFNGLAVSSFLPPNAVHDLGQRGNMDVYFAQNQLYLNYEKLHERSTLHLFDLNGRLIQSYTIPRGEGRLTFNLAHLTAGAYFYQLENTQTHIAGKLIKPN